jgi:hypothetical protein
MEFEARVSKSSASFGYKQRGTSRGIFSYTSDLQVGEYSEKKTPSVRWTDASHDESNETERVCILFLQPRTLNQERHATRIRTVGRTR